MKLRVLPWLAWLAVLLAPASVSVAQPQPSTEPDKPTEKTFKKLSEYIQPDDAESAWEKIGWHQELMPAVEQAKELGRPILLWAMNGHPCGHT